MVTFDELFDGQRFMAILRGMAPAEAVTLATRAWDLGIGLVEVPIQTPDAVPSLEAVVAAGRERGRGVGSGTVVTLEQVEASASAGAAFTVAPGTDGSVLDASRRREMPHLPGVATATEVQRAQALGVGWVKAFPAATLGASWFRTMRGPFPGIRFVATGGMDAHNADEFLAAGVSVVAVGSALSDPRQIDLLAQRVSS
ncbi:bifunctional 4-hydroxy-2-oxoglutarate aldolase/2-dehydro-3-deoxy-phosphogluconate aldolase [Microbacterium halotolerans]|uniref:bifunctional 4-hydroxy-2-oxoglutarate aldolase/2-dehydro-3-deoxy-phosphogluconate aldolase n=1 Tax=Microbacterium halotolerans TaxID=246613 RepID=UPI001968A890|nr:bifunctional 4-hydroxy-2-oxoglutarate aldolase/2-dehydro-3-deoxy-phosphogluconate aldolase [Microbacterium halotolerans]